MAAGIFPAAHAQGITGQTLLGQKLERAQKESLGQKQVPEGPLPPTQGKGGLPGSEQTSPPAADETKVVVKNNDKINIVQPHEHITTLEDIEILLWIFAAGAFGGFVDGLVAGRPYAFRWNKKTVDIGSLGDILVGAAAGLAIFTVATAVFKISLTELQTTDMFVRVVAWGVLSGFAGLRILQGMSEKLVKDIATKAAEDAVKKSVVQDIETEVNIKDAEALLAKYDIAIHSGWLQAGQAEAMKLLEDAKFKFELALQHQRNNELALRGTAKIYKRMAEVEKNKGNIRAEKDNWDKAIAILTTITDASPSASVAFYNLACYKQLSGVSLTEVISCLRRAIEVAPVLKSYARSDADFIGIANKQEFKDLTQ
jgi:hypothetical protein